jgi:hypothetical protein
MAKIVVKIRGGMVDQVVASEDAEVVVIDYDTDGAAEDVVMDLDGEQVIAWQPWVKVDPAEAEALTEKVAADLRKG